MGRRARKLGGWVALFALALQLALGFGHVHPGSFAAIQSGVTLAAQPADGHAPDDDDDSRHARCDICAVMQLAGTLLLPAPPVIALQTPGVVALPAVPESAALAHRNERAFQARAPPQA